MGSGKDKLSPRSGPSSDGDDAASGGVNLALTRQASSRFIRNPGAPIFNFWACSKTSSSNGVQPRPEAVSQRARSHPSQMRDTRCREKDQPRLVSPDSPIAYMPPGTSFLLSRRGLRIFFQRGDNDGWHTTVDKATTAHAQHARKQRSARSTVQSQQGKKEEDQRKIGTQLPPAVSPSHPGRGTNKLGVVYLEKRA